MENISSNEEKLNNFDFIRISTPDLNGCHLSKLVPAKFSERILNNEVDLFGEAIALGFRAQPVGIQEFINNKTRNAFLYPDLTTLKLINWASGTENHLKIGEVIADMKWDLQTPLEFHPRIVAQNQIKELAQMDLEIYSAFEPEFRAFKLNSFQPYTTGIDIYKTSILSKYEKFFIDVIEKMSVAGVGIQDCFNEQGEGQLEMPLLPSYGIESADNAFRFKQGIKEISIQHNMTVSFMTKPIISESSNGNHFNHSLWYKSTNKNAMYNANAVDNLSDIAKYWIGGLMKHLPSISALCCPTVNCYRRLHKNSTPDFINWDINDRSCSIRVKNRNEKSTYIENRLPSSASCSYHVIAATIAAGIDGIKNKIVPPQKSDKTMGNLPFTFEEALNNLDENDTIKKALGEKFVNYFLKIKRKVDLNEISAKTENDEELLNLERNQYFEYT